jgi:ubiquinone/menaquinone biosynthesis C-methylase UbiE
MGCGDGEMLRKLSKALRKEGIAVALIGIDLRDDVLEIARSKSKGYSDIEFKKQDILTLDKGIGCDILLCTLTMHHFTDEQIKIFTKKFYELASIGVVINDLERNILSYQLFKLFSFFFIKTSIAKTDGLISISKGFRKQELIDFAKNIPNVIHVIKWKWAFRYVWVMQTNRPS